MSFPASPTIGQQYTIGPRTWEWTGNGWKRIAAGGSFANPLALVELGPFVDFVEQAAFFQPVLVQIDYV